MGHLGGGGGGGRRGNGDRRSPAAGAVRAAARRTLLRRLVFALLLYAALVGYFRLRAKALSPAIAEARLQALQARIRPHFLFNSINAVLSLVRGDPARAERRCRTWPISFAC